MTTTQNQLILRQALYRFFASLYLYPDQELLESLKQGAQELLNSHPLWENHAFDEKLNTLITILGQINLDQRKPIVDEYNRLFLVKPLTPPYETTYIKRPGQSEGILAAEISGLYGQAGLVVSPETNELPDHIAIELEFMSFLCEKELKAAQEDDDNGVNAARQEQQNFISQHLALWFPKFAKKALEEGNDTFYKSIIEATFAFLRSELVLLEIRL